MNEIGEELQYARESSGVSLNEASKDLGIKVEILENIEDGRTGAFKDIFELKEYISSYAKYLGLDGSKLVDQFNEFLFDYTSKIPLSVIEQAKKEKENEKREIVSPYTYQRREKIKIPSYVWYILIATLVIVIGYVIISHLQNDDFKSDEITYVERG